MEIKGLYVFQKGSAYQVYLPTGIQIALIAMPPDGQVMRDCKALAVICRALAWAWSVKKGK